MSLDRREFLKGIGRGTLATVAVKALAAVDAGVGLLVATSCQSEQPARPVTTGSFDFKCLWVWGKALPRKTQQNAIDEVAISR